MIDELIKLDKKQYVEFEVSKIKVLLLSIHYPFAIKSYFETAIKKRQDIDLITTGPFTGSWIPWMGGMSLPSKYSIPPTIPLPFRPNVGKVNYELVKSQLPKGWIPDIVLSIDAGINWTYKPTDGIVVTIGTDPHVLDYSYARSISDKFFNMQRVYMESSDIYLPYAYSPEYHYYDDAVSKDSDAVLIGMPYDNRVQLVNALRERKISVIFENGPVFDDARILYNRGKIGLNWSSMLDMNARVFEIMAMKMGLVTNNVPDLDEFFVGGVDYCRFSDLNEAVEQVEYLLYNPNKAKEMAEKAYTKVLPHTYDSRISQILKETKFI